MKDWDLTLFSQARIDPLGRYAYGLRENLLLGSPRLYHYAIIADLVLRFSWAWRVLPGLSWLSETESGLFMLMFLEVARRWMWVFFRVEAEHCTYRITCHTDPSVLMAPKMRPDQSLFQLWFIS